MFINVRKPKDALQLAKEPEIRSHVARYQWKQIEHRPSHSTQKDKEKALGKRSLSNRIDLDPDGSLVQVRDGPLPTNSHPTTPSDLAQAAISIPPPLGGIRVDPFRSYPVAFKPFLPQLVDHCKQSYL